MEHDIKAITPIKIAIISIILIIIIGTIYIFIPKHQNEEIEKEPELIHITFENTVQNHILFSDIKIFKKDDEFYFTAKATNMTSNMLKISPITITLKDNQNNKTTMTSYLGDIINGEEEKNITVKTNKNLKNIKSVELNITTQVLS